MYLPILSTQEPIDSHGSKRMSGQTISHYEITEELATGPDGTLFLARERVLGQTVAIQILDRRFEVDESALAAFRRTAKSASALNHPHIATILEIGQGPSGSLLTDARVFVVTSIPHGWVSADLRAAVDGSAQHAAEIARQVADALSAAHELGLVHGKVIPDYIQVTSSGNAILGGFGMAGLRASETEAGGEWPSGFIPPEVRDGHSPAVASDLWSLGAVLYDLISGAPPELDAGGRPVLLSGVSPELTDLVDHLLDPNPERRPTSARAVSDRLQEAPELAEAGSRSVFVVPQSRSWSRLLLGAVAVSAVAATIWAALRLAGPPSDTHRLAVVPFEVDATSELAYLSEGIVDVLGTSFDSVGDWTMIAPDAVIGWSGTQPTTDARDLAQAAASQFGADRIVTGTVTIHEGPPIIQATVFKHNGRREGTVSVTIGPDNGVLAALDELSTSLAALLDVDAAVSAATSMTSSTSALKLYLRGASDLRHGDLAHARSAFESAVVLDTSFALAWSDIARVADLEGTPAVADEAVGHALQHTDRLSPTNRTLIRARDLAFRQGQVDAAASLYKTVLRADQSNVDALTDLGNLLYRYNPHHGKSRDEAEPYFRRALRFAPNQAALLGRMYDFAIEDGETTAADSLRRLISTASPTDAFSAFVSATTVEEDTRRAKELLESAASSGGMDEYLPGTSDFLLALVAAAEGRLNDYSDLSWRAGDLYRGSRLVSEVLVRSIRAYPASAAKLAELQERIAQWDTLAYPVHMLDDEDVFKGRYVVVKPFLSALVALRAGDDETLSASLAVLSNRARGSNTRLAHSFENTIRAADAYRKNDDAFALSLLSEAQMDVGWSLMTRSQIYDQGFNRLLRASILLDVGRIEESLQYSESVIGSGLVWGLSYLGPSYLKKAEAYAALGDRQHAVQQYKLLMNLWSECDPELVELRENARVAMFKLTR